MDIDLDAIIKEFELQSFAEKCENYFSNLELFKDVMSQHLIVFNTENENRREIYLSALKQTKLLAYEEELDTAESEYDYRYLSDYKFTEKRLFKLLKSHNGKIVILEADTILTKQTFINILQGAVCSSPDSGSKWTVYLDGEKKFTFTGTLIILTSITKEKFLKSSKYEFLNRDIRKM